jgi:DNA repair protein RecN (Recombination protein N)
MIVTLNIRNFALIEKLRLDLAPGLNVFTGETGAGKSLIIQAFSLLLGERAPSTIIRKGCESASVEALFDTGSVSVGSCLDKWGLSENDSEGSLLIGREIGAGKKGSPCFVNGRLTVLGALKELGDSLVDLHGQHDHQALMKSAKHLSILDDFSNGKQSKLLEKTSLLIKELRALIASVKDMKTRERERRIERDNILFQINQIDDVSPVKGEDVILEARHKILANSDNLKHLSAKMEELISSEAGVVSQLRTGWGDLDDICEFNDAAKEARTNYHEAVFLLEEVGSSLSSICGDVEFDEEEFSGLEDRIGQLNSLFRKYGPSLDNVIEFREDLGKRLKAIQSAEKTLESSDKEIKLLKEKVSEAVVNLSEERLKTASRLEKAVNKELKFLEMKDAVFSVNLWQKDSDNDDESIVVNGRNLNLFSDGVDRCEFVVATNRGEKAGPLSKIASGGEVSRVMLAIKSALASQDRVPIMVFDEIDVGIGGETGWAVARKLFEVSRNCQCLCITHLPQIAAFASAHYNVAKSGKDDRTVISVSALDEDGRVEELARMLGGSTSSARAHAEEFLQIARKGDFNNEP